MDLFRRVVTPSTITTLLLLPVLTHVVYCSASNSTNNSSSSSSQRLRPTELPAKTLYDSVMRGYKPMIRPSPRPNEKFSIKLGLRLSQINFVDEKEQILSLSVWLRQEWHDSRLQWAPGNHSGVRLLNIPSEELWIPDLVLYNNADGDFQVTLKTKALVYHTGTVVWEPPAVYKSYCPIDVEFFPFDIQECFLKFSSWTYHGNEVDLQHLCNGTVRNPDSQTPEILIPRGIDLSSYYYNVEWDVINATATRRVKFYSCCPDPFPDVTFNLTLRRRPLFYAINLVMPCVAISCLTVLVFYLPSASGEKVSLSISILLALTLFFLILYDMNPPTSLVIPLIGKYLLFILLIVTTSVMISVAIVHVNLKSPTTDKMSPWIRRILVEILPQVLFMKGLQQHHHQVQAEHTEREEQTTSATSTDMRTGTGTKAQARGRQTINSFFRNQLKQIRNFIESSGNTASGSRKRLYEEQEEPTTSADIRTGSPSWTEMKVMTKSTAPNSNAEKCVKVKVMREDSRDKPSSSKSTRPKQNKTLETHAPQPPHPAHSLSLPPEVVQVLEKVTWIGHHLRDSDVDLSEERDWQYAAIVLDRLFLFIFGAACIFGTFSIFLYAPSLYDPREHLSMVDPQNTCIY